MEMTHYNSLVRHIKQSYKTINITFLFIKISTNKKASNPLVTLITFFPQQGVYNLQEGNEP